jgi:hypothetical protein
MAGGDLVRIDQAALGEELLHRQLPSLVVGTR